jgi:predicted CXXCH cytochrome family protein
MSCHNPHSSDNETLLKAVMPDLCFTCHDKTKFKGAVVHSPVGVGLCTSCHAPHTSKNAGLLKEEVPDICFTCHDKGPFSKKSVHAPVMGGMCTACHGPHATNDEKLLLKRPIAVCLDCHADVRTRPHAVTGFSERGQGGHFLGSIKKPKKIVKDPARRDREFYCGGCHDPHSSDWGKLFRYKASGVMGLCQYCHKF